jgi:hypothetical protein|tara:strand:- start:921 stop:1496 length:576 start_codon:yes stop_codon:yes gene_type:complete
MPQTSTTILSSKDHKADVTGTDISFNATGSIYKITSTSTTLNNFAVRDLITVTGTTSNNSTFTVKEVTDANNLVVEEIVTTETADGSTTTTLDHTGFVSDKAKGDGYFSQPDGVHTVSYKVTGTLTGSIKMQASLATTPTEDDYFDISGTTFTTDQSTTISSANFTGNFVWVRAKATGVTAGSITSILLNN